MMHLLKLLVKLLLTLILTQLESILSNFPHKIFLYVFKGKSRHCKDTAKQILLSRTTSEQTA